MITKASTYSQCSDFIIVLKPLNSQDINSIVIMKP